MLCKSVFIERQEYKYKEYRNIKEAHVESGEEGKEKEVE